MNGGISGGNPDPISRGTAWLYLQFAKGTLAGYNYGLGPSWQRQRGSTAGDDLVAGR